MPLPIQHANEAHSNRERAELTRIEPHSLRTFTPTQAVIARSAGVFHWTPEGKRLYDFTSGVLVSNLGHNPASWMRAFARYMGWEPNFGTKEFTEAVPMTAYNAITPVEVAASNRLLTLMRSTSGGARMEQVMWAASGSEAIQKALWAAHAFDKTRPMILATRFGFHGKKGLANAVTGSEADSERDPRVRFISFPMEECRDLSMRNAPFDFTPYQKELDALWHQFGARIGVLITEPYLGGGGSFHPPKGYLQSLQKFCRANNIIFILDEVQSNFGRTQAMFAYDANGLEPDIAVLGKGLGNGVPVAAAVGRGDILSAMNYGEGSDTWSANPLCCAAVQATLDEFASHDVLGQMHASSAIIERGLVKLKEVPFVANIRGEQNGMVWGVEMRDHNNRTASEWANAFVLACYEGDGAGRDGIHLLGPLAKKVVRISPPLVITESQARDSLDLMHRVAHRLAN